jgi:hypothetical protein
VLSTGGGVLSANARPAKCLLVPCPWEFVTFSFSSHRESYCMHPRKLASSLAARIHTELIELDQSR